MIHNIRNWILYYFLPNPGKLGEKFTKPQLNLAEKISLLFNTSTREKATSPISDLQGLLSDLQGLQSASVGAKLGVVADLGLSPLPTFVIDTSCVVSGMYLRQKKPVLGYGLIGYGLTDNLFQAISPMTNLFIQNNWNNSASDPFSQASQIVNHSISFPGQIASICASTFFAALVPIAGFISYKHSKYLALNSISDLSAIKYWVAKAKTDPAKLAKLQETWDAYAQKHNTTRLEALCEKLSQTKESPNPALESKEALDFIRFLLDNAPRQEIQKAKEEILASHSKKLPDDPIETGLAIIAIAGGIALVLARILRMLTERSIASANLLITALTAVSIVGIVVSVLTSAYQTYQDFRSPNILMPQEAKMFSLAKLVSNIATAALLTATIFIPGANICLIIMLGLGVALSAYASYKRSEILQKRVSLQEASSPETVQTMQALLKEHRKEKEGTEMSTSLRKWVTLVKSDPATASLATA